MSTFYPNELSGMTTRLNTAFNSMAGVIDLYSSASILQDATAPTSPSNCAVLTLPAFALQGGGQFIYNTPNVADSIFVGQTWRCKSDFGGRFVADKLFFIRGPVLANAYWGLIDGPRKTGTPGAPFHLMFGHNTTGLDNSHIMSADFGLIGYANAGNVDIIAGNWYRFEAYVKKSTTSTSRDGIVRWWINGTLCGNYTTVNYSPGGLNEWQWNNTWDGGGGMGIDNNVEWQHWLDDLYVSTGGGGGVSTPTLSTLTPTAASLSPGNTQTLTIAMSAPVSAATVVALSSSSTSAVTVPASATVASSQSSVTFQATAVAAGSSTVTATLSGVTKQSVITVASSGGGGGGTPSNSTYAFQTQYSGVQGQNQWSYRDALGNLLTYDSGTGLWTRSGGGYVGIWSSGCHPGPTFGVVLRWTAPSAGSARITGNAQDVALDAGDGVLYTIVYNSSTTLFSQDIGAADGTAYPYDVTQTMATGDFIDFIVAPKTNDSYDSTLLDPTIVFTVAGTSTNPSAPTISSFTPTHGNIASSVTIVGTNFNSTPTNNAVAFNGAAAPVTSASTTQLVVTVPPFATTGAITVTTSNGTATGTTYTVDDPITPVPPPASNFGGSAMMLLLLP